MLSDLVPLIQKLTEKKDLTVEEAQLGFTTLAKEDLDSYFYFVFTAALHTKGETSDELLGFCQSAEELIPRLSVEGEHNEIIDVSGTGGAAIKRLNVDTVSAFTLQSKGARVAKQSFMTVTGITGSADVLRAFGVDPIQISRGGPLNVKRIFEETGLVTYVAHFLASPENMKGAMNWAAKRQEIGLNFITIYHLVANAYSAIPMKRRVYGVFDSKYIRVLAELFQKLGYEKGIVCHGVDGLDEMSNVGETKVAEFERSGIKEYSVNPKDLGVRRAEVKAIQAVSREGNICDFLRVLYGREKGAKRDLVAVNAGAAFYVMGYADSFREGTKMAMEQMENGEAARSFEEYVKFCGDLAKLEELKKQMLS